MENRFLTNRKEFAVGAVSSNVNSFGLSGMVLVGRDGETWEVAANSLNVRKLAEVVRVPLNESGCPSWAPLGFEIPRKLSNVPDRVVREVWDYVEERQA